MNDYSMGALEALSFVRKLLEQYPRKNVEKEIRETIQDILNGVSVNFKEKAKMIA